MRNTQHRRINAPAHALSTAFDQVGGPHDALWPAPAWPRLVLNAGLTPGSSGGHGIIHYRVTAYEPGRRVRFAFDPALGLRGYHEFSITPEGADQCRLTHTIEGDLHGRMLILWPLVIRWMHEALLQDLLDNAERIATGAVRRPARWSLWVRLLRRIRRFPSGQPGGSRAVSGNP